MLSLRIAGVCHTFAILSRGLLSQSMRTVGALILLWSIPSPWSWRIGVLGVVPVLNPHASDTAGDWPEDVPFFEQ
jgi:hypothetical protein